MAINLHENSLLLRESETFELEDDPAPDLDKALSLTLAGKLLTGNRHSLSNLTYFTSKQWECANRLKVYDHGQGLYTLEFISESDVHRAIARGPWFIEGKLLLLQRINPFLSISQLVFETTKIWVRCFNLPPKVFNVKFAMALGNMLGYFCDVDLLEEGSDKQVVSRMPTIRKFLRIKVLLRLDVPLKRTQSFKLRNNEANMTDVITTNLAYERLPVFCYRCGLIGHDMDNCSIEGPILYGKKIRAEKYYRSQNNGAQGNNGAQVNNRYEHLNEDILVQSAPEAQPEVTNPLTLDSDIILANFRSYRDEGPLPPVPISAEIPQFGSLNTAIIPFINSDPNLHNNEAMNVGGVKVDFVTSTIGSSSHSILGIPPEPIKQYALPPVHPIGNSKSSAPTYFNPLVPNSDLFYTPSQRCLFKTDPAHPSLSNCTKTYITTPPDLSPITVVSPMSPCPGLGKEKTCTQKTVKEHIDPNGKKQLAEAGDSINRGISNAKGKRPMAEGVSKLADTPRPKRGRPSSVSKLA